MSTWRLAALAAALSVSAWAAVDPPSTTMRCTVIARPWVRADTLHHFTATARPDTLFVRQFRPAPGPGVERQASDAAAARVADVYGQVARLDGISAPLAGRLEQEAEGMPPRVLLVLWGMDSLCRREVRAGSAQWMEPNEQGFFAIAPLPAAQWVPGTPTFDVDPIDRAHGRVYIPDAFDRELRPSWWRRLIYRRPMTVDEYRQFHEALPTMSEWQNEPVTSAATLTEWERQNRGIAGREPARSALQAMREELQHVQSP